MKIKIGIPRALLYYRHNVLWKNFFEKLNCNIVLSPPTNKEILELGKKHSIDEACLSSKVYIGHAVYLIDKCDYLLIPRICDYGRVEKVCVKFNGLYDQIKTTFQNKNILNYNIEHTKHKYEFTEFIKMGLKLNKNIFKIIYAYIYAKKKEKKYNELLINTQNNIVKNNKLKILIVAHPYNIYDEYLGHQIVKMIEEQNISLLYADKLNKNISKEYSKEYSKTLYWTYSKELIGAVSYYKNIIDGIIFVTSFPCGPDSLVNELLIRKIKDIPICNIIIDESNATMGIQTRIESFIDIVKEKKLYEKDN